VSIRRTAWACLLGLPALLGGLSGCSTQVKWTPFLSLSEVTWYYDERSIRHYTGGLVRVLVLEDHRQSVLDRRSGQDYTSARQFWEFNCTTKSLSRLSVVQFSGHGGTGADLSAIVDTDRPQLADPQSLSAGFHQQEVARQESIASGSAEAVLAGTLCG
jgi:hypothetical protein